MSRDRAMPTDRQCKQCERTQILFSDLAEPTELHLWSLAKPTMIVYILAEPTKTQIPFQGIIPGSGIYHIPYSQ